MSNGLKIAFVIAAVAVVSGGGAWLVLPHFQKSPDAPTPKWDDSNFLTADDTDQEKSASFEREDGASWGVRRGLDGAARTGGAARHAGQCAE